MTLGKRYRFWGLVRVPEKTVEEEEPMKVLAFEPAKEASHVSRWEGRSDVYFSTSGKAAMASVWEDRSDTFFTREVPVSPILQIWPRKP